MSEDMKLASLNIQASDFPTSDPGLF